jgi:hypothetical protein
MRDGPPDDALERDRRLDISSPGLLEGQLVGK